jgi:N-acetylmuramoyl-L-alanine amidase
VIAGLLLAAAATSGLGITLTLSPTERLEWRRGDSPVLLVLPRSGEGWRQLAARVTGSVGQDDDLREENPGVRVPLRDVRVRVPWELLAPGLRVAVLKALFPLDRRIDEGWEHVVGAPWGGEPENWWEMAQLLCGEGSVYHVLRGANAGIPLFPQRGDHVIVPARLLIAELRRLPPIAGGPSRAAARTAALTPVPTAVPTPASLKAAGRGAALPTPRPGPLEYHDDVAIYRLRPGEALYSAVVMRFTGQLHGAEVNTTATEIARRSGIDVVTSIPVGFPVKIPYDLLLPEYLPPDDPRRQAWESSREELAAIRRAIHAANLDGIHVILDAGHGGEDAGAIAHGAWESSREELAAIRRAIHAANLDGIHVILDAGHGGEDAGAIAHGAWETTYVYDVMSRIKRVLERETKATVWATVQDMQQTGEPPEIDVLPQSRRQRLLVQPAYDLSDSVTGVQLRWVLSNAILTRLKKQKVDPERVAFVSIHADSLHPAVRGLMIYVPSRSLRPSRGLSPARIWDCREAGEAGTPTFPAKFRSRAEALSEQLGDTVVAAARRYGVPVHPFQPVRDSVLRGGSRWVPAVLRYNLVPTSVLIELCNLNNDDDRAQLLTWRFREKLAHAIAAGLAEGFSR